VIHKKYTRSAFHYTKNGFTIYLINYSLAYLGKLKKLNCILTHALKRLGGHFIIEYINLSLVKFRNLKAVRRNTTNTLY
jgi:hypothetical protein